MLTFYLVGCLMVFYLVCDSRNKHEIIFFTLLSWGILIPAVTYSIVVVLMSIFTPHLFIFHYLDEMFNKRQALARYARYKLAKKGIDPFTLQGYNIIQRFLRRYL